MKAQIWYSIRDGAAPDGGAAAWFIASSASSAAAEAVTSSPDGPSPAAAGSGYLGRVPI